MELPKFDFSKAPHPQLIDLFAPLIPGAFFEISVLATDHQLIVGIRSFGLGPYSLAALFIFTAYFCGLSAMVFSNLLLRGILQTYRFLRIRIYQRLQKFEIRVMHESPSGLTSLGKGRIWIASKLQNRRLLRENNARTISRVWGSAATQLLAHRYGINSLDEQFTPDEWSAWRVILGVPTYHESRGTSLVRALGASGWAGLLARHIAWPLHLFHYRTVCIGLIIGAMVHAILIERFWMNPIESYIELTRNVLRDISQSAPKEIVKDAE
jgi:hypothetical protein